MITSVETVWIIVVVALCTLFTRALPFIIFKDATKIPEWIIYLGKILPMAIMFCLVVYCVRNTNFLHYPYGIAEILGIVIVVILHRWKRNNMLSIVGGTLCYMFMVQFLFV